MTTPPPSHIVSLSIELAQPDDVRRESARRWQAALHRLCLVRATMNEAAYEAEWARIFENKQLMDDLQQQQSKLLAFAALDALEVQHDHALLVCRTDGIAYDSDAAEVACELLATMRTKIEKNLP